MADLRPTSPPGGSGYEYKGRSDEVRCRWRPVVKAVVAQVTADSRPALVRHARGSSPSGASGRHGLAGFPVLKESGCCVPEMDLFGQLHRPTHPRFTCVERVRGLRTLRGWTTESRIFSCALRGRNAS